MRKPTLALTAAVLTAAALSGAAQAEPQKIARAVSAERFATPANYTGPQAAVSEGQGYSARARRVADCLADQAARSGQARTPAALERRCDI